MKEISVAESKQILFDCLVYFDRICREHDIHYSLGEGSLLGAVRHRGFIPWDDDIDILMLRTDFEKFLSVHQDGRYKIYHVNNDINYWNSVARLSDETTAVFLGESKKRIHGLWLGLTPLDYIPDDEFRWARMKRKIAFWVRLCRQHKGVVSCGPGILGKVWKKFLRLFPIACLDRRFKHVITRWDKKNTSRLCKLNIRYEPFVFPASFFDGYTELEFEGRPFMAINHYDDYLNSMYGDYMTPPPEDKRQAKHDFKAYYINN